MPKYPTNLNGPSLTINNITDRWELKDKTGANSAGHLPTSYPTAGTGNLSGATEVLGDMYRALSILRVEQTAFEKLIVHFTLPVKAATTAALPAVTYANGTAGVGATLTADANGALAAQDGISMAAGDRLLVKNQAAGLQNGIYVVTTLGTGGSAFVLTRAADADTAGAAELSGGLMTVVEGGTTNGALAFICTNTTAITVGTTAVTFAELTAQSQLPADTTNFVERERKYAVQLYSFKMYPIIEESMRLAYKLNRLRTDIAILSGTGGDQVPAAGRYPSGFNRGY